MNSLLQGLWKANAGDEYKLFVFIFSSLYFFSPNVQVCALLWEKVAVRWKDPRDLAVIVKVPRNPDLGQFGNGAQGCQVPCVEGLGWGHSADSCVPLQLGWAAQHQGGQRFCLRGGNNWLELSRFYEGYSFIIFFKGMRNPELWPSKYQMPLDVVPSCL